MSRNPLLIALDGGAASGKSTTARLLATRLNLLHVDTGAHYRTLTLLGLEQGWPTGDAPGLADILDRLDFATEVRGHLACLTVDGRRFEPDELRSPEVNRGVSLFAALRPVRRRLLDYQRSLREVAPEKGFDGVVMEGRDIGSVIFPDAPNRFFLEADPETRTARRALEGQVDSISDRDRLDSARPNAPLTYPSGAIRIDTGRMDPEAVVAEIRRCLA